MVQSKQWVLAKQPTGSPQLSGPEQTFKLVQTEIPAPKDDQLLLKLQYLSNDPAQRGWIGSTVSPERLYVPQIPEGQVMRARGLCEVVESQSSRYRAGDSVLATVGWSEFACVAASEVQPAPELPGGLNRTHYLGALGMTGMTAYFGLMDVAQVKAGDVVVVSGAAGAVGSMAVQIAKKMVGCRKVIGMAGTDEKCRWVENLGADQCLNCESGWRNGVLSAHLSVTDRHARPNRQELHLQTRPRRGHSQPGWVRRRLLRQRRRRHARPDADAHGPSRPRGMLRRHQQLQHPSGQDGGAEELVRGHQHAHQMRRVREDDAAGERGGVQSADGVADSSCSTMSVALARGGKRSRRRSRRASCRSRGVSRSFRRRLSPSRRPG